MARKIPETSEELHQNPHIDCAHIGCHMPAIARIKTKIGWNNLCNSHYDRYYAEEAYANLDKWGMARLPDESKGEHTNRMREFVKTGFKRFQGVK